MSGLAPLSILAAAACTADYFGFTQVVKNSLWNGTSANGGKAVVQPQGLIGMAAYPGSAPTGALQPPLRWRNDSAPTPDRAPAYSKLDERWTDWAIGEAGAPEEAFADGIAEQTELAPGGRHLTAAHGRPFLPAFFADHAVLQRGSGQIFGWQKAHSPITVRLLKKNQGSTYRTYSAADGLWKVPFLQRGHGGPYEIHVAGHGSQFRRLRQVYFGEIFLLGGQSNAARSLNTLVSDPVIGSFWHQKAQAEIAAASNSRIHLFAATAKKSQAPVYNLGSSANWFLSAENHPQLGRFSAMGYLFAKSLQPRIGDGTVHVGVFSVAVSGTSIRPWMSSQAIGTLHRPSRESGPALRYKGEIAPLKHLRFGGVIWYQGENEARNRVEASFYEQSLGALVADWRRTLEQPQIPFFIVGLAGYRKALGAQYWPQVREGQRRVAQRVGTLITTADCSDSRTIHPPNKWEVGKRIARAVRAKNFAQHLAASGPNFSHFSRQGHAVLVHFDGTGGALLVANKNGFNPPQPTGHRSLLGFEVQDSNLQWHPASSATVVGDKVRVSRGPHFIRNVRYGWRDFPSLHLYSRDAKLPAAPFTSA